MNTPDPAYFHQLYGEKRPRLAYHKDDFLDYVLMSAACVLVAGVSFGWLHPLFFIVLALGLWMVGAFVLRHGVKLKWPALMRHPQEVLYMLVYKVRNLRPEYFVAVAILLLENVAISLTPGLPHHSDTMRAVAIGLFYAHVVALTAYRTAILVSHLRRRAHVREFLLHTTWKSALERQPSVTLEILHAYCTGLMAHALLIAPWYIVLTHVNYSLIFLPATIAANLILHVRFMKAVNAWFYRDHWLGHNSEVEFLYLHGAHHDAIPSGLIGVSGNGFLEGFMRYSLGGPGIFYSPVILFVVYTLDVKSDIDGHQFIPGVYPHVPKEIQEINQHSTHHYGRLEPYSLALNVDQPQVSQEILKKGKFMPEEMKNSIRLDQQLTGFEWDTPRYRRFLELYERYLTPRGPQAMNKNVENVQAEP